MPNNDFHDDYEPNAIERDRMERREQTKRKGRITSILVIVIAAVVIIGIIIAVVALVGKNKKPADTTPTAVTATIASETQAAKETTNATTPQSTQPARDPALNNISSQGDNAQQATLPASSSSSGSADASSQSSSSSASSSASSAGGSYSSGNALHYTASGQTSYGYDWTYSGGGGIVNVSCNYDFNSKQYDFNITGVAPGTASLTLYYNTADGVQQPVNMTVQVDSNLNVTQIG